MCGICCRNIDLIPQLKEYDNGNGMCIHLSESNLCNIYSSRPDICNMKVMYEKEYSSKMSLLEYETLNELGCKKLQKEWMHKGIAK